MINEETEFEKVPGLFRAFDLPLLIEQGRLWRIEDSGRTDDGQPLFAVYQCCPGRFGDEVKQ